VSTRVVGVVNAHTEPPSAGQQEQTIEAARNAVANIEGCFFAVVLSYAVEPDGQIIRVEAGVFGQGPRGFPEVVNQTMHATVAPVVNMMREQERAVLGQETEAAP
jgi:hypothetical protein